VPLKLFPYQQTVKVQCAESYFVAVINLHRKPPNSFFNDTWISMYQVDLGNAFPPELLVRTAAADETFFHVIPQHGTINLSPKK
jgi:hypothetical protein